METAAAHLRVTRYWVGLKLNLEPGSWLIARFHRGTRCYRSPEMDAELVVSWLAENPGWHSRGEIVLTLALDVADWSRPYFHGRCAFRCLS